MIVIYLLLPYDLWRQKVHQCLQQQQQNLTIPKVDRIIPEVDQCFLNLGVALIILATMDLVT